MYVHMKHSDIRDTLIRINDLSNHFPMLKANEINFYELAKHYQTEPRYFFALIVFLDMLKAVNENSTNKHGYFVDINEVKEMKVRKNKDKWTFQLYTKENKSMKMKHTYQFH